MCKTLYDLKDAEMLWAQSPKAVAVPWQQEGIFLFPWQQTGGVLKEGLCRAPQRRLPALCCSLEQKLWAHSGALILQLTRRSELE